jgi:transcriptional antiterminator NusG
VIKNGKKHETVRKTLPGYIFAKMNLNGKSWQAIRNVKGCVGFAGNNAKPVPLTKEETERFGIEEPARIEVPYKIGDSVQIIEGPLNGFFGKVKEIELEKEVISVMVSMFGRETPVELRIDDVEVII